MMDPSQARDKDLAALKKTLIAQEAENREFFERLGISSVELLRLFQEEHRFPADVWQKIQQERQRIEARLDDKIQECNKKLKKDKLAAHPSEIKGHWIFIR